MANELRQYSAFQGGMLDTKIDTTAGGSFTFSSPAFANLPAVDASHHMMLSFDPFGLNGAPEKAKVTAHTAAATTLTATGAQGGSVGRVHYQNEYWTMAVELDDLPGQGFGIIGVASYATPTDKSVTNTTSADIDATNFLVTFTSPPTGKVIVTVTCSVYSAVSEQVSIGLRESTTVVATEEIALQGSSGALPWIAVCKKFEVTGVSSGSHTYKASALVGSGTGHVRYGGSYGTLLMQVEGVNV